MRVTVAIPLDITQKALEAAAKEAQIIIVFTNTETGEAIVSPRSQSDFLFPVSLYYFGFHMGKYIAK